MANPIIEMISGSCEMQKPQEIPDRSQFPTSMDDPRMAQTKQYVQDHGGNPKAAFYQLCKEKALNPANIINMFLR